MEEEKGKRKIRRKMLKKDEEQEAKRESEI